MLDFIDNGGEAKRTPEQLLEATIDRRSITWHAVIEYVTAARDSALGAAGKRSVPERDADHYRGIIAACNVFLGVDERLRARTPTGE